MTDADYYDRISTSTETEAPHPSACPDCDCCTPGECHYGKCSQSCPCWSDEKG
jgi:hypothetical protein